MNIHFELCLIQSRAEDYNPFDSQSVRFSTTVSIDCVLNVMFSI